MKWSKVAVPLKDIYLEMSLFFQKGWVKGAFTGIVLLFAGFFLYENWEKYSVSLAWGQIQIPLVVISTLLVWLIVLSGAVVWYLTLRGLAIPISTGSAIQIHLYSNVVKYIPGSIWQFLFKYVSFDPQKYSWISPMKAITLEFGLVIITGIFNGLIFYPATNLVVPIRIIGLIGALLMGILPFVLARIITEKNKRDICPGFLCSAIVLLFINWNVLGFTLWILANAIEPVIISSLPAYIFSFNFAVVGGIFVLPVPQGVGIRESIMLYLLEKQANNGYALILAGFSRLQIVLGELFLAGFIWLRKKLR